MVSQKKSNDNEITWYINAKNKSYGLRTLQVFYLHIVVYYEVVMVTCVKFYTLHFRTQHLSLTDVFSGFLAKLFVKYFAFATGMTKNEISS